MSYGSYKQGNIVNNYVITLVCKKGEKIKPNILEATRREK